MKTHLEYYRSSDGEEFFCFAFEQQPDGAWRAYIASQPDYGDRPDGAHETHRLTAEDDRWYVCWTTPLATLAEAKTVAALWADETQKYRKGLPAFQDPHE